MRAEEWLALPRDQFLRKWYAEQYADNAYGSSAGAIQRLMHSALERGLDPTRYFPDVLELGGNVGEHIPFVRHGFSRYTLTDVNDSLDAATRADLSELGVTFAVEDACRLSFDNDSFDRVLNTCLLHHVDDPEAALGEIRRVLRPGGIADVFLSSDPGLMFRLARECGPVLSARRAGLGQVKRLVDARDHIHHVGGLRRLVQHVFRHDALVERTFPLAGLTWNSSLWITFRVVKRGA